jgi:hypothetical protein
MVGKASDRSTIRGFIATIKLTPGWKVVPSPDGWKVFGADGVFQTVIHRTYSDHRSIDNLRARLRRAGLDLDNGRRNDLRALKPSGRFGPAIEYIEPEIVDQAIEALQALNEPLHPPVRDNDAQVVAADDAAAMVLVEDEAERLGVNVERAGEEVNEMAETKPKRAKQMPTQHFVKEALRAHVDSTVTSGIIVSWVRKEHGAMVRQGSVSTALANLMKDTDYVIKLDRVSTGVYHVSLRGDNAVPAPAPVEKELETVPTEPLVLKEGVARGDLVEVVHVDMNGRAYGTDQAGALYRIEPV